MPDAASTSEPREQRRRLTVSTNDINEADLGVSVLEMRESDIVPDLRLILDETIADVDGITVSAEIHPAFDPDSAADGEGALLVRFTDKEGRSRVAELEIKPNGWRTPVGTRASLTAKPVRNVRTAAPPAPRTNPRSAAPAVPPQSPTWST